MKTKNLTQTEREELVFFLGGYTDDEFYTFYYLAMDMFLKDLGYPTKEREKIKNIGVFKQWFARQFEKRDTYIIEKMLVYNKEECLNCFQDGYYSYSFYNEAQFREYYELLHQDFETYDELRMSFNFKQDVRRRINQHVSFEFDFKCPFTCEQHRFFYHLS